MNGYAPSEWKHSIAPGFRVATRGNDDSPICMTLLSSSRSCRRRMHLVGKLAYVEISPPPPPPGGGGPCLNRHFFLFQGVGGARGGSGAN